MGRLKMQRRAKDNIPWRIRFYYANVTERNRAREYVNYGESKDFLSFPLDAVVVAWFAENMPYVTIDEDLKTWVEERVKILEIVKEQKKAKTRRVELPLSYAS